MVGTLLLFRWPYNVVYLLAAVWIARLERPIRRRSRSLPRAQDRRSARLIDVGAAAGAIAALALAILFPAASMPMNRVLFWMGIVAIIGSGLIRRHCFRMLGNHFTGVVYVVPGQPVIEQGLYRWVRHPGYTAGALSSLGIGLVLANWASLFALLIVCIGVYTYRVRVEERALIETLGAPYLEYQKRTRRFIPFLF